MRKLVIISGFILITLFFVACVNGETVNSQASEASFVVRWYDVGLNALAGRKGVLSVERGWLGSSEINRVLYDPEEISLEKMEKALKKTGTFIRTVIEQE